MANNNKGAGRRAQAQRGVPAHIAWVSARSAETVGTARRDKPPVRTPPPAPMPRNPVRIVTGDGAGAVAANGAEGARATTPMGPAAAIGGAAGAASALDERTWTLPGRAMSCATGCAVGPTGG